MAVIMTGVLMTAVDTTIVVLALPEIQRGLHVDLSAVVWVIISFLLVITLLATQVGRLGDMFGRVRMYETGFAVFVLGSLACALAWNEPSIIAFRILQGVGGAFIMANSGAVIADLYPRELRGKAYGYTSVGWTMGAIIGIVLGGVIVTCIFWRWIFWINVPVGVAALAVATRVLHDKAERSRRRLDLPRHDHPRAGPVRRAVGDDPAGQHAVRRDRDRLRHRRAGADRRVRPHRAPGGRAHAAAVDLPGSDHVGLPARLAVPGPGHLRPVHGDHRAVGGGAGEHHQRHRGELLLPGQQLGGDEGGAAGGVRHRVGHAADVREHRDGVLVRGGHINRVPVDLPRPGLRDLRRQYLAARRGGRRVHLGPARRVLRLDGVHGARRRPVRAAGGLLPGDQGLAQPGGRPVRPGHALPHHVPGHVPRLGVGQPAVAVGGDRGDDREDAPGQIRAPGRRVVVGRVVERLHAGQHGVIYRHRVGVELLQRAHGER